MENKESINDILDKLLELNNERQKPSLLKIIFCTTGCVMATIILVLLCFTIYTNDFDIDSLLSLLLAFFSIFISVFFYIKASDTSNKFYDNSYSFTKDISVTLGKIEERFGEKLNTINDKMTIFSSQKMMKTEELNSAEDEKQKLIDELLEKTQLQNADKELFKKQLYDKEREANLLKQELTEINNNIKQYNEPIMNYKDKLKVRDLFMHMSSFSEKDRNLLMRDKLNNNVTRDILRSYGYDVSNSDEVDFMMRQIRARD